MRQRKQINWIVKESFDDAGDGHTYFHYATGIDKNTEKQYQGVAVMIDDNLEEIEDIEEIL
jgi:predicted small secreted protein